MIQLISAIIGPHNDDVRLSESVSEANYIRTSLSSYCVRVL